MPAGQSYQVQAPRGEVVASAFARNNEKVLLFEKKAALSVQGKVYSNSASGVAS